MSQLFLDLNGVLGDFDNRFKEITGQYSREFEEEHGSKKFWKAIRGYYDFFATLDLMPDAEELVEATEHLNPIILTGCPLGNWAQPQKKRWVEKYFPHIPIICCESKDKINHAKPGDIIIDDWNKHRSKWIAGGGIWITHTCTKHH